jgi:hypothetical protein
LRSASPQPGGLPKSRSVGAKRRPPVSFGCKQHPTRGARILVSSDHEKLLQPEIPSSNRPTVSYGYDLSMAVRLQHTTCRAEAGRRRMPARLFWKNPATSRVGAGVTPLLLYSSFCSKTLAVPFGKVFTTKKPRKDREARRNQENGGGSSSFFLCGLCVFA